MDLYQLRTFISVAKNRNFTRASEELNLSQPAVSHQIKSLETQIGDKIFDRGKKGVELTPAGSILFDYAAQVVSWTDDLRRRIKENRENVAGIVATGATTRSLEVPFAAVSSAFHKIQPDIKITFHGASSTDELFRLIENSTIDVCLTEQLPDPDRFDFAPYGLFELCVVVGPGHRLANRQKLSAKDFENEKWALFEKGDNYRGVVDDLFEKANIAPKSVFSTNDGAVIVDMISSGQFVSLIRATGIQQSLKAGRLIRLDVPELETLVQVYLAWRKDNNSSAVDVFVEFFLEFPLPGMNPDLLVTRGSKRLQRHFRTLRKAN